MRRIVPFLAALVLAAGVVGALPGRSLACSCIPPVPIGQAVAQSPELAVFVGTVTALQPDATTGGGLATIEVEGTFRGPALPPAILARSGNGADCGLPMSVGERRLFTARVDEQGTWSPGICDPQVLLGTPEGDAALAEAEAAFGSLQPTAGPPPLTNPEAASDGPDLVVVGIVAAGLLLVLVGGALLVRRRRPGTA
jgi:MYXO-CTERM domain-containing protein